MISIKKIFSLFFVMMSSLLPCWGGPPRGQSADTIAAAVDDHQSIYFQIPDSPINYLTDGTILAMAHDADGEIVGCALFDGELPPGIALANNGTLLVTSQKELIIGTHQFEILTVDENRGISAIELTLTILPKGYPNAPSQAHIPPQKSLHLYKSNEVLAKVWDLDGTITRTQFVRGELPPGTHLTQQGKLLVDDPQALKPAIYDFIILVEDQKGGASFMALTIPLFSTETASHP